MVAARGKKEANQHRKDDVVVIEDSSSLSSSSSDSGSSKSATGNRKARDGTSEEVEPSINQGPGEDNLLQSESCRHNKSTQAYFTYKALKFPFAEGGYRYAAKGRYVEGPRKGQKCVAKWLKKKKKKDTNTKKKAPSGDGSGGNNVAPKGASLSSSSSLPSSLSDDGVESNKQHPFERDIRVAHKTFEIVHEFNDLEIFSRPIQVTIPEVWKFDEKAKNGLGGVMYIQEPFIRGFQKFNCSSGWVEPSGTSCSLAMQALSHFSYHITGGQFLLNDIQGGEYPTCVVITDPVIHTRDDSDFADGDLGPDGIISFFRTHTCNRFCDSSWRKLSRVRPKYTNLGLEGARNSDLQPLTAPKGVNALARGRLATGGTAGYKVVVGDSSVVARPSSPSTNSSTMSPLSVSTGDSDNSSSRSTDKTKQEKCLVKKKKKKKTTTAVNKSSKYKRARTAY